MDESNRSMPYLLVCISSSNSRKEVENYKTTLCKKEVECNNNVVDLSSTPATQVQERAYIRILLVVMMYVVLDLPIFRMKITCVQILKVKPILCTQWNSLFLTDFSYALCMYILVCIISE